MKQKTDVLTEPYARQHDATSEGSRPTIVLFGGLMGAALIYEKLQMWQGVAHAALAQGANLVYVAGAGLEAPESALYELIGSHNVDGIISWNSFVTMNSTAEQARQFLDRFRPLPVVNIELDLEGFPNVEIDDTQGMRDVLAHLIDVHGYRRIVYLAGRAGRPNIARRQAFQEVMTDYGLYDSGLDCASLEELHNLRPGVDYQAVVTAVDSVAVQVGDALRARGVRVPGDVAVTGFNDSRESVFLTPALTTVRLPFYEMGQRAAHLLLDIIAGETAPARTIVPLELIVRRSCGCTSKVVGHAAVESQMPGSKALRCEALPEIDRKPEARAWSAALAAQRASILSEVQRVAPMSVQVQERHWDEQLFDAFTSDLEARSWTFVPLLEDMVGQAVRLGMGVDMLHEAISAMRQQVLPWLDTAELAVRQRAEDLWQQARILIGETVLHAQMYQAWQLEGLSNRVSEIGQALAASGSVAGLLDVLARQLPPLGIASASLALFERSAPAEIGSERPDSRCPEWAWLALAFDRGQRAELDVAGAGEQRFPSRAFLGRCFASFPDRLRRQQPYHMMVQLLNFREEFHGLTVFEFDVPNVVQEAVIYEMLRQQIGAALHAVLLLEQQEQSRQDAETVRRQLEIAVRDLESAQRQYLDQRWTDYVSAQAAQGYVFAEGRISPAEKEWLSVMSEAIKQKQRVVQGGGTGEPSSGEQRSIGIPLVLSGEVIGVLGGLGADASTWSQDDLAAVDTVVEQMSLALETHRLLDERQQASALLDRRVNALGFVNELGRRIEENMPLPDLLTWLAARIPLQVQYPDLCRVAIRLNDQVYGMSQAIELPHQITQGLRVENELLGQIYVAYADERDFVDEDSALLGDVARRLSGYIESRRLLEATQVTLEESQVLYQASAELNAARTYQDILTSLQRHTVIGLADLDVSINLFSTPWVGDRTPHSIDVLTRWSKLAMERVSDRYDLTQFPAVSLLRPDQSLVIEDVEHDPRLDDRARYLYARVFQGRGTIFVPLVVGGQWIGYINAIWSQTIHLADADVRRLMALSGQAAVALQGIRQLEETQRRVRREQILREITTRVRGSADLDIILRAAVRELGTALNRRAFVRLGSAEQLSQPPTQADAAAPEGGE